MISDDIFLGGRDHQEKYLDVGYEFVAHILNSIERLLEIPVEKKNVPLPRMGANIGDGFLITVLVPTALMSHPRYRSRMIRIMNSSLATNITLGV
jgi:hypothetical protein